MTQSLPKDFVVRYGDNAGMDNLPVASQSNVETSGSRTASPVRPKALVPSLHPRHNVTPGSRDGSVSLLGGRKRSDSAVTKPLKKRSPLPLRKGQQHGEGPNVGSTCGLYVSAIKSRSASNSGSQEEAQATVSSEDFSEMESVTLSALTSSDGSSELMGSFVSDDVDGGSNTPDLMKTKAAIEHVQQKIIRTKETIKSEQTQRDNNVNEYLKCAANADKQQLQRIKSVFEKRNQKSAQTISQLQKKLENYNKRLRDLETYGLPHRQTKEVLRDVGQGLKDVGANIRDGITVLSGSVMSKPREFAHLIKNKFGSADNINNMTKWFVAEPSEECTTEEAERNHHGSATFTHRKFSVVGSTGTKYTSEDDSSSITSGSGPTAGTGTMSSPRNQPQLSLPQALGHASQTATAPATQALPVISTHGTNNIPTTGSATPQDSYLFEQVSLKLQERQEECQRLQEDVDSLKNQLQHEITYFHQALQEERYRYERLEEQMNDLIELHQNEVENLKQGISDMEEKVQYQSEERLRDMHEMLESFQTKISRMEHQQQQHQQLVTLEGIENSNARALVLKLINILLTVLQVVLLLVATAANILMPFLKTRMRVITTVLLIIAIILICRQWPDLVDIVHTMVVGASARL